MKRTGKNFYVYTLLACLIAYAWIWFNKAMGFGSSAGGITVCTFRNLTTLPCPSCGSTASVLSLMEGDPLLALHHNPIGLLLAVGLLIIPLWVLFDLLLKKQSLFGVFHSLNRLRHSLWIVYAAAVFICINWIWILVASRP